MKKSLAQQRQALEHCLAMLETYDNIAPEILDTARQGCRTLKWLHDREQLTKALTILEREEPGIAAVFETFPDARITDVRETSWKRGPSGELNKD